MRYANERETDCYREKRIDVSFLLHASVLSVSIDTIGSINFVIVFYLVTSYLFFVYF